MTRVAVYAEVDMNLIDGSSIWLQSVSLMLATLPETRVTVLLRTPQRRVLVTRPLVDHPRIELVDPERRGETVRRLGPADAVRLLSELDREQSFDVVLLRGADVVDAAVSAGAFEGRIWFYYVPPHGSASSGDAEALTRRAGWCRHIVCQTEAIAERVSSVVPDAADRLLLLPPMIPDGNGSPRPPLGPVNQLLYAGKFSPEYYFLEMVDLFAQVRSELPQAEWHVAGDKIHNPPDDPAFRSTAERALQETAGLVWHGAIGREEVTQLAQQADLALSLRHPSMDVSSELSTKILEYGAAGCPVLLNRNPLHISLLGSDYPLLAGGVDEAREAILMVSAEPQTRADAQRRCRELSERHTFSRVAAALAVPLGVEGRADGQREQDATRTGSIITAPGPAPPPIRNPS